MRRGLATISALGAAASFGAAGLSLALAGLGLPFLLAAMVSALCAGLLLYILGRLMERDELVAVPSAHSLEQRVQHVEDSGTDLRHNLRGVLSPALMMADRLLKSEDPAIRRAGDAVVRSVERATALLADNKRESATATAATAPDAVPPRSPPPPAETGARAS